MLSKNQKPQLSFIEKITIRYKFSVAFLVGLIGFSISILYGNQFYISCTLFFAGIFSYLFMSSYIRSSKQWADEFTATNSITESGKNVLTPHQMLQLLGFNVSPQGVSVNPTDLELYKGALKLIGSTINPDLISDDQLIEMRKNWKTASETYYSEIAGQERLPENSEGETINKMRGYIKAVIVAGLKFSHPN